MTLLRKQLIAKDFWVKLWRAGGARGFHVGDELLVVVKFRAQNIFSGARLKQKCDEYTSPHQRNNAQSERD
jgi:hypothetical protein